MDGKADEWIWDEIKESKNWERCFPEEGFRRGPDPIDCTASIFLFFFGHKNVANANIMQGAC